MASDNSHGAKYNEPDFDGNNPSESNLDLSNRIDSSN